MEINANLIIFSNAIGSPLILSSNLILISILIASAAWSNVDDSGMLVAIKSDAKTAQSAHMSPANLIRAQPT